MIHAAAAMPEPEGIRLVAIIELLYASGMIPDEVEEQTLTYLLVRPLPKWAVYAVKLLATVCVVAALVAAFVAPEAVRAGARDLPARQRRRAALRP